MLVVALGFSFVSILLAQFGWLSPGENYFQPTIRLSGIGVERQNMSDVVLTRRTELMIESQTFGIMRDPRSLEGAQRISSPKLRKIFNDAAQKNGLPTSFLSSIAYLESWGDARAQSPAGPKGIMQFAEGTARAAGLRIIRKTKYRIVTERRTIKPTRGKAVTKIVRRKVPYTVLVSDERLVPEKAVPAAARYLAYMENRYGGRDWAVFAYHCGEGCVGELQEIVRRSHGLNGGETSVAKAFFSASPAHNRELYQALRHHMERDYSPTYWFRIRRAEQLLQMFQEDRPAFEKLYNEYRYRVNPDERAPHRLSVWLTEEDLAFQTCDDLKRAAGSKLVKVFDAPKYFGFALRRNGPGALGERDLSNQEYYLQASPSVVGTLAYLSYETRRLHEAMKPKGEKFVPLEVTALVRPIDYEEQLLGKTFASRKEVPAHCTGLVFDLSSRDLPPGQREALDFVLNELGWSGYLGFVKEDSDENTLHIGCSPGSREFFTRIFDEAMRNQAS